MWSSGTGFAGVFGYAWVVLLHSPTIGLGFPFAYTLMAANVLPMCWLVVFSVVLTPLPGALPHPQRLWHYKVQLPDRTHMWVLG